MQDTQEIITISENQKLYRITVKRNATRKNIALTISDDGDILIKSPVRTSVKSLEKVVKKHQTWIVETFTKIENRKKVSPYTPEYKHMGRIMFLGKSCSIVTDPNQQNDYELCPEKWILTVRATQEIEIKMTVKAFYRHQAQRIFTERLQYWLPRVPQSKADTKLVLKYMKSRWGSMSSRGTMNLNISLVRTPMECIDYVIVHEICHQPHPHHQPPFWRHVQSVMPDYKKYDTALKSLSVL